MDIEEVKEKSKGLNNDLKIILGRPNFACGQIAETLRRKGIDCKRKAEEEQALTIHTMLSFYERYGDEWNGEFAKFLTSK